MKARDMMTTSVVSVDPDTPVSAIAKTLSEHGISAAPFLTTAEPRSAWSAKAT